MFLILLQACAAISAAFAALDAQYITAPPSAKRGRLSSSLAPPLQMALSDEQSARRATRLNNLVLLTIRLCSLSRIAT